jgi:hypothetical protein
MKAHLRLWLAGCKPKGSLSLQLDGDPHHFL